MKTIVKSIASLFLLGLFFNVSAHAQGERASIALAPEKAGLLVAHNIHNDNKFAFTERMEVQYWLRLTHSKYPLRGTIEGFTEDTIFVSGRKIPLESLFAIKKVDKPAHNVFKVVGPILGVLGFTTGILGGTVMLSLAEDSPHYWAPPFLIAGISLYTGFIPVAKGSKKFHISESRFSIIFTEPQNFISKKSMK